MTRISATEVMIEHNSKLARDPVHLRRLVTFWPEENIVHQLAKQALADMEREAAPQGWVLMPEELSIEMATAAAPYANGDAKEYYRALVKAAQEANNG